MKSRKFAALLLVLISAGLVSSLAQATDLDLFGPPVSFLTGAVSSVTPQLTWYARPLPMPTDNLNQVNCPNAGGGSGGALPMQNLYLNVAGIFSSTAGGDLLHFATPQSIAANGNANPESQFLPADFPGFPPGSSEFWF